MAKSFYNAAEAAEKLGMTEEGLKKLVREGSIREFRDGDSVTYRIDEIDALVPAEEPSDSAASSAEIVLEPVEDSGIELAASGSDILSLDDSGAREADDTSAGTKSGKPRSEDSAVPSIGINVFDDAELDEAVDPLAQTAVSDVAGLGMEGTGSGSGILDLTKESDDTSLGAELLDEIYTGEEQAGGVEMSEDTRAGLEEAVPEEASEEEEGAEVFEAAGEAEGEEEEAGATKTRAVVTQVVEFGPDAVSTGLTAALIVAVVVMWFAGLAGASLVRGVVPGILQVVYANLAIFAGGALAVGVAAAAVTYFVAKRAG